MTAIHDHAPAVAVQQTRRAWWSLLGFGLSFPLAFLVGEGLIAVLGYPPGGAARATWWAALAAVVPALVVFALPAVLAVHFGRRAVDLGDLRGRVPMWLAVGLAAGFALLNGVSGLLVWLS